MHTLCSNTQNILKNITFFLSLKHHSHSKNYQVCTNTCIILIVTPVNVMKKCYDDYNVNVC